jgi:hypothetical protein
MRTFSCRSTFLYVITWGDAKLHVLRHQRSQRTAGAWSARWWKLQRACCPGAAQLQACELLSPPAAATIEHLSNGTNVFFSLCRLYPSSPMQPPRQCLAPTCTITCNLCWDPTTPPPHPPLSWTRITKALLVPQDRRHLLVTPRSQQTTYVGSQVDSYLFSKFAAQLITSLLNHNSFRLTAALSILEHPYRMLDSGIQISSWKLAMLGWRLLGGQAEKSRLFHFFPISSFIT